MESPKDNINRVNTINYKIINSMYVNTCSNLNYINIIWK